MPSQENPLIQINTDHCKKCYACIRACPVNAIVIEKTDDFPKILNNRCIGCGSCYTACTPDAIIVRDGKDKTKELINSPDKVAAVVAPSISGEFDDIADYRKFVEMIRALGFDYVNEVTFGVDLVAMEYKKLFSNFKGKYYIMSNCPSVTMYIEKYKPGLVANLAPLVSPMNATSGVVRQKFGQDIKVVYIGPCIAAKEEAIRYNNGTMPDAVLTFYELRQLFDEFNITEGKLEYSDFDPPIGYRGSLYPISNGILQAAHINEDLLQGKVITTVGRNNMIKASEQFEQYTEKIRRHFNIFYDEGCMMGPGTKKGGEKYLKHTLVTQYANKRLNDFDKEQWEASIKSFQGIDFKRQFKNDDQRLPDPPEEKVREIMKAMGKRSANDNLGCSSCGYKSCRDFAVTVAKGLARTELCVTYATQNRKEYIKALKISNEKLASTQKALKESERKARREQNLAKEASERITTMMQKLPSGMVIVDDGLKIIESNEQFIQMLGEDAQEINEVIPGLKGADLKTLLPQQFSKLFEFVITNDSNVLNKDVSYGDHLFNVSVFGIKKNKVVGAVIRDMYLPEVRKEEVINRVSEVIDDNLTMVQKIGFILGENASVIEKKLNSILESHKKGKGG